jgi:hypothetical protein
VQPVERPVQELAVLEVASSSSLGTAGLDLQVIATLALSGCQHISRSGVFELPDPHPDPIVSSTDPDPSLIKQK